MGSLMRNGFWALFHTTPFLPMVSFVGLCGFNPMDEIPSKLARIEVFDSYLM